MQHRFIKTAAFAAIGMVLSIQVMAQDKSQNVYLHYLKDVSGFVFDPASPDQFTVATPHGIFSVEQKDGLVKELNSDVGYLTELVNPPHNPKIMLSSGYKSKEEKFGVLKSKDGGKTWEKISDGVNGPVAFYAMAINVKNPNIIYGVDEKIQVSHDAGKTWKIAGDFPGDRLFDIAVSPLNPNKLYAATYSGLFLSEDGAKTWKDIGPVKKPVASVNIHPSGELHAFVFDYGYITKNEKDLKWKRHAKEF